MNRNRIKGTEIFLIFLALILIGVSFYQTWIGLEQIFGSASLPISFVLSGMLLFLSFLIRNAKLRGDSTLGLLGMYCFIALFCFMANFNALYTRFMKADIYVTELRKINDSFVQLENKVNTKLNYKYSKDIAQTVETKKKQLMMQIQDKGNLGLGLRALNLIKDIEKLLHTKIDILKVDGKDFEDLAMRMGQQIDQMLSDLSPEESKLKVEVNLAVIKWGKKIQEFLQLNKIERNELAQQIIDEAIAEYNKLGVKSQTVLGEEKMKFENFESKTYEIGKIGYAFSHAVFNFGVYQIIVLMGCFLLDFLLPFLVLLITSPSDNDSTSVFKKRKGGVLIPKN